jgi:hypothetical protein
MWFRKTEANIVSKLNYLVVGKHRRARYFAAIDASLLQRVDYVGARVATDNRMAARKVSKDRQRNPFARRRLADHDGVVEAHEKSADRIDP